MNNTNQGEYQPLLSSEQVPTILEDEVTTNTNEPVSMQIQKQETSVHEDNPERPNNVTDSPESNSKPNTQVIAAEGFLAICGSCRGKVLFPLGFTRVNCVHCGALNYMSPQTIPMPFLFARIVKFLSYIPLDVLTFSVHVEV
ncbi:hypothetical protein JH06_3763 [Blastocystis sp. subtype 4]|uniref:hypothetical protein n=1 Tax=Blastocystis sp. subtype 4 TaxID=944170 RepID=UPI000711A098|nr:hypothetical protein JH06_3763 [Blastocystis sp. subtype 4]KNB42761.1 hypothetical protein JH06_3763 [Blastocystis sp. subtype 4]|eukprot:XP_014526204.1 hypothetical protein JH06_3763 [Blastocystis sp. subtype 4]